MRDFLPPGRFSVGANYWASHAGLSMWSNWKPDVVERDFALLAAEGLQLLRIFPLWPDFQPIHLLRGAAGKRVEFRHGEQPLPGDEYNHDGVSLEMLDRFGVVADLASKHGLDLIVGLITGWMSGRLFVPPALEGLNPITDPISQMWQIRLARRICTRFVGHPAIRAWDLGNECNVMGEATREQAWLWTASLANAIRAADPTRPVISGMHSLQANPDEPWSIRDQGELTDILTTHPYPLFTPHCNREPLPTMRPLLHATAETCLYSDLGGKPAFVEEFGTLGPMVCGDDEAAGFVRASLVSQWAHDGRAALWWCAHDQVSLDGAPYDWVALERELGLVRADGSAKPALREIGDFRRTIHDLPFDELPPRRIDAVCILTPGQDSWGVAYSAFVLAKQAGFDLRFHFADRTLPEASLYLLPSLSGLNALSRRRETELWGKVRAGATAYVSFADGFLGQFQEATGSRIRTRSERQGDCVFSINPGEEIRLAAPLQYELDFLTAVPVAAESHGQPCFFRNTLGSGEVFVLMAPLEASLARKAWAFDEGSACWKIYRAFSERTLAGRLVQKNHPLLGITEHDFADGTVAAVCINYSPEKIDDVLTLREGFRNLNAAASPTTFPLSLPPSAYRVLQLART